jgi:transposase
MRAYSVDLRERVVKGVKAGGSRRQTARLFGVSEATVKRYLALEAKGDLAPKTSPGRPRRIPREDQSALESQVEMKPDATLEEHCRSWEESKGVKVSITTMHRSIRRAGYTLKRKR